MSDTIICPKCGAPNQHSVNCIFCGSPLTSNEEIALDEGKKIEKEYIVDMDERILIRKYDEFRESTSVQYRYDRDERGLLTGTKYAPKWHDCKMSISYLHNRLNDGFIFLINESGSEHPYSCWPSNVTIQKDNRSYFVDCKEGEKIVKLLSEAKSPVTIKTDHTIIENENAEALVLLAQVFYHTFRDSTKYGDAADKLYNLIEEKKRKRELEKIEKEQKEKCAKEEYERQQRIKQQNALKARRKKMWLGILQVPLLILEIPLTISTLCTAYYFIYTGKYGWLVGCMALTWIGVHFTLRSISQGEESLWDRYLDVTIITKLFLIFFALVVLITIFTCESNVRFEYIVLFIAVVIIFFQR